MQTILVLNSKGGSGKTTITTNIACMFTAAGIKTTIMDYDPQGSSMQWRRLRCSSLPEIPVIDASTSKTKQTRTWQLKIPSETERVIIDAPAGAEGLMLQEMLRRTDMIVIPVAASPIDIHATADFVRDLLMIGKIRQHGIRVGVIANRVRRNTPMYEPLQRFLGNLRIPFLTTLSDTDNYIIAAEQGIGIHEMDEDETALEREQWQPLAKWLVLGDTAHQQRTKFVERYSQSDNDESNINLIVNTR